MITGPERKPKSGNKAQQLVIILHGWGADGANLIDLADMWRDFLPDAYFIAPNAPEECEVNPYGYQWFSLMDRTPSVMMAGLACAQKAVNELIDTKLAELDLPIDKCALVGFSQGTMTALHVGLRRAEPVACILGYSGALLATEELVTELASSPPISLIHGEVDDVVPFANLAAAEKTLKDFGLEVQTHPRPGLGHSIDMTGMEIGRKFLVEHLIEKP